MQSLLLQALWEPLAADPRFRQLVLMAASTLAALLVTALPQHPFLSYTIARACIGLVSSALPLFVSLSAVHQTAIAFSKAVCTPLHHSLVYCFG